MFQNQPTGVPGNQMPDYLNQLPTMQQQQNKAAQDRARQALTMMGGQQDPSASQGAGVGGLLKKFCL